MNKKFLLIAGALNIVLTIPIFSHARPSIKDQKTFFTACSTRPELLENQVSEIKQIEDFHPEFQFTIKCVSENGEGEAIGIKGTIYPK